MEASITERPTGADTGAKNVGRIEEIQGVVLEAVFPDKLPNIYNAIRVRLPDAAKAEEGASGEAGAEWLGCEGQQHRGDGRGRAVAMDTPDGLSRGLEIEDTGGPISVPVGEKTLGRIFNVLGDVIDQKEPVETEERWPIHRPAPTVENLTPTTQMFEPRITRNNPHPP